MPSTPKDMPYSVDTGNPRFKSDNVRPAHSVDDRLYHRRG